MKRLTRSEIAKRAAQDLPDGAYVNLGGGLPTLVANYILPDRELMLHSENGILGIGPFPQPSSVDANVVNASERPVTIQPGGSFFSHNESFIMIRGGHIDIAMMGAFQVSETGDLANWSRGRSDEPPAIGGAIDLAVGAKQVWILMEHCTKDGSHKIVRQCTYPFTGSSVVTRIFTDLAVIDVELEGLIVRESIPELSFELLQQKTGARLRGGRTCKPLIV